jgi:hypothetical protein
VSRAAAREHRRLSSEQQCMLSYAPLDGEEARLSNEAVSLSQQATREAIQDTTQDRTQDRTQDKTQDPTHDAIQAQWGDEGRESRESRESREGSEGSQGSQEDYRYAVAMTIHSRSSPQYLGGVHSPANGRSLLGLRERAVESAEALKVQEALLHLKRRSDWTAVSPTLLAADQSP